MTGFSLVEATAVLAATPATMRALLGPIPASWATFVPTPGAWSAADVLRHLIFGEMTDWIPRARIILAHGEAHPFDPFDHQAQFESTEGMSVGELLDRFEAMRSEGLADLDALGVTEHLLAARGTHPAFGPVTMAQLIATWAAHDLNHVSHATEMLAKRYAEAVGPWRAYLSIMDRAEG